MRPSPLKSPATRAAGRYPAAYRTWSWKVPSPLPSNTDTSLEPSLATARSVRPSPLKSPATRALWPGPRRVRHLVLEGAVAVAQQHRHVVGAVVGDGQVGAAVAVEVPRHEGDWPVPRRVPHLVLEGAVAVAQQHRHVVGAVVGDGQVGAAVAVEVPRHDRRWGRPAAYRTWFWKVPSPLPSNTDTSLEPSLATARSVRPSPLKSPATRASGAIPAAYRTWSWKVPSPLPSNTDTSSESELATARSVRPSPLKSPATMAIGHDPHRGSAETAWWLASKWSSRCRRPRRRGFPPRDSRSPPGHAGRSGRRGCRVTGRRSA